MNGILVREREKVEEKQVFSISSAALLKRYKLKPPLFVEKETIKFNIDRLEIGRFYPIELQGEFFLLRKIDNDVVDIYGVVE